MSLKPLAGDGTKLEWFKSSHSTPDGAACVEIAIARGAGIVHVRDSKNKRGSQLVFPGQGWAAFVSYAAKH